MLAAGCAINPVSGRPEVTLVSETKEREIGETEARRVAESMGLVDDPALIAYVRAVGERLARFSPRAGVPYRFAIVEMEEPNAFALPGGYVYVSRGLLVLTNSEDELAGVVAHEIGHVAARHAVRRVTRAAPLAVLTGLTAMVTGIVSPTLGSVVGGIGGAAGALILAPYSRDQEREADRVGQDIVAKAGWDPAGLSRMLRTLEREEAMHGGTRRAMGFFATHPPLPRRVAETEEHARELERGVAQPIAGSRRDFLRKLEGLVVGPRAAEGVFDGETFLHPDLDFHVRFPAGWKTANEHTVVGAQAPDGRAVVVLETAGEGSDPEAALRALEKESKVSLASSSERRTVNGLPAVHATARGRTRDGHLALDLTWIAHADNIYRLTGATPPSGAEAMRSVFRATADSFGPLTAAERAAIRELRLDVVDARAGETLATLLARTDSAWSPEFAAVANGLEPAAMLRGGEPVKVAVSRPYAPRRRSPAASVGGTPQAR